MYGDYPTFCLNNDKYFGRIVFRDSAVDHFDSLCTSSSLLGIEFVLPSLKGFSDFKCANDGLQNQSFYDYAATVPPVSIFDTEDQCSQSSIS